MLSGKRKKCEDVKVSRFLHFFKCPREIQRRAKRVVCPWGQRRFVGDFTFYGAIYILCWTTWGEHPHGWQTSGESDPWVKRLTTTLVSCLVCSCLPSLPPFTSSKTLNDGLQGSPRADNTEQRQLHYSEAATVITADILSTAKQTKWNSNKIRWLLSLRKDESALWEFYKFPSPTCWKPGYTNTNLLTVATGQVERPRLPQIKNNL